MENPRLWLTSTLVNRLLYGMGASSVYDMYHRSKWRLGYQALLLCSISSIYLATIFLQEKRPAIMDQTLDLAKVANNVILTFMFLYFSGILIAGMVRFRIDLAQERTAVFNSTSKEMDLLKIKLGVQKAEYKHDDTVRITCYIIFWLAGYFFGYSALKMSNLTSFPLGHMLVNNTSFFLCNLIDHSYICCLNQTTDQFDIIERMLMPLLLPEEAAKMDSYKNLVMHTMSKRAKVETLRIIFCLHR